jgi:GTPase SAR1 family protein
LANLYKLNELVIKDNPIVGVPENILQSSAQEIVRWLKENTKNEQNLQLKDVKVLLLGNTNIGKSNLLHLWSQRYDENENNQEDYPEDSNSTHGLVYKELVEPHSEAQLHIWDFGGQEYFHATHQLFFSPDALHIILWAKKYNPRLEKETVFSLEYWLRCAEQLSKGNQPIETVLVENYIDFQRKEEELDFYTHFPETNHLKSFDIFSPHEEKKQTNKPQFMINSCAVSLKHKKRIEGLFELMEERIGQLHARNQYPPVYVNIRNSLAESDKKVWTLEEYRKEFNEKDATIVKTLHRAGCLLYFDEQLPDKIFTHPDLLLNLIYDHILNDKLRKKDGRIGKRIPDFEERKELQLSNNELKDLLLSFKLIFSTTEGVLYAPQYLPEEAPVWLEV